MLARFNRHVLREIYTYVNRWYYRWMIRNLCKNGLDINVVYDIGAEKGSWTNTNKKILPNRKFFLFDANDTYQDKLRKTGCKFFIQLLSADGARHKFYSVGTAGDSLYLENTKFYDGSFIEVPTKTLDQVCAENSLPPPDYMKLDVQGAELDILVGGSKAFASAKLVMLECPVSEYNLGAPSLTDYLEFMRKSNFYPLWIVDQGVRTGILLQTDILFLRKDIHQKVYGPAEWKNFD